MATSEGIPSSIDIEFLELNDNPYYIYAHVRDNNSVCLKNVSKHRVKQNEKPNNTKKKVIEIHLFVCYIAIV